ncbi:MAG: hypothetical protein ACOCRK_02920 [bacterium]
MYGFKKALRHIKNKDNVISFPKEEHESLVNRLNKNKPIYTTRVSTEMGKYKACKKYISPWGDKLKVIKIDRYNNIENHPFYNELSQDQIKLISNYDSFELIKLIKV